MVGSIKGGGDGELEVGRASDKGEEVEGQGHFDFIRGSCDGRCGRRYRVIAHELDITKLGNRLDRRN